MEESICLVAGCENIFNINQTRLPIYFAHFPAGSSVQNTLHYQQNINDDEWAAYNYGESGNIVNYGSPDPPLYNLSALAVPTAYFYGSHDKRKFDPALVSLPFVF